MVEEVGEVAVKAIKGGRVGGLLEPQDQALADEAGRAVVGVEGLDFFDGLVWGGSDAEQGEVGRVDEMPPQHFVTNEVEPAAPVGAAFRLEKDDGMEVTLTGLDQGQELEGLVQGTEAAGQQDEGARLLEEGDLAGEEVLEVDQLAVTCRK